VILGDGGGAVKLDFPRTNTKFPCAAGHKRIHRQDAKDAKIKRKLRLLGVFASWRFNLLLMRCAWL